ncbi:hypothetical protein HZA44_03855 [Candidatus Peregrinibacteria bacterium]|nr:hypothetical protein [Candidatus Peregrinibacteria bacterium]
MAETPHAFLSGMRDQDGNEIEFLDLHRRFAETPMGQALATKARYDRYRPDSIPPAEWERLLGRDVNNLKHMELTYELAQTFLKDMMTANPPTDERDPILVEPRALTHLRHATPKNPEQSNDWWDARFSAREIQILLLTAIVHDWAEADPTLGDITYDLKKDTDEKKESQILILMLRNQLGEVLSPETLETVHKTATDRTGKLGEAFNVIERIGYLRTALNAWRATDNPTHSEELINSLQWLCSNVLGNQIPALLKLFPHYEGVRKALDAAVPIIDEAFKTIPDSLFDRYPEPEREIQRGKYLSAKAAWDHF